MTAERENDKAKQTALENAARESYAKAAAEQARREAAEQVAREAQANAATEKTKREAAEQATREALVQASADKSAREAALRAAQESATLAAAERSSREAAEKALHEATIRSAADRSEREAATKTARDAASGATAERVAREAAERALEQSSAQAASERAAREAVEASLRQNTAKGSANPQSSAAKSMAPSPSPSPTSSPSAAPATSLATTPQSAQNTIPASPGSAVPNWLIPLAIFAGAGLLFFVITSVWTSWENNVAVKTDDAYVRADVAPLSTKSSGIVKTTTVNDFQSVKAGQILVELKNDEYKARVDQAEDAIRQTEIKVADMKQRKELQDARVAQARSALESSQTSVTQVDDTINSAEAAVTEAKAGIDAANAAIIQSEAASKAAEADLTKATQERVRHEALLADESATKEKVEQVVNENERAIANVVAQKAAQSKAKAELAARKAQLTKATQQLLSCRAERKKSLLTVDNHRSELTAQTKERELLDGEEKQLISDLSSKKAGLTSTTVDLDYTTVRAPADGIVGELKVKPGQLVSAGTQVITIISAKPWVIANYRETQLVSVREGDRAEVDIDALPGTHLSGHVGSIAPASGAQFSLLPPDNASGNFTKITQRIPVKIILDDEQKGLANLRPGMSATATVTPGSRK